MILTCTQLKIQLNLIENQINCVFVANSDIVGTGFHWITISRFI